MTTELIKKVGSTPQDTFITKDINDNYINHNNWTKWTNLVQILLDSSNYYGFPSVCLNSDFNWERGIAPTVTQATGDAAFISEKWQIHGASIATYAITHPTYTTNTDNNPSGSRYSLNFNITNYAGDGSLDDFYMYQQQSGAQFLQQYQERIISMSARITNNQSKTVNAKFQIYFYFDTASMVYDGDTFDIPPGISEVSAQIETDNLTQYTVGAAPYVQFRLVFCSLGDDTADLNVQYVKAELADDATVLYVDHALEKTRIDNS